MKRPHHQQSRSFLASIVFLFFLGIQTIAAQTISDCSGAVFLCGDLYTETEATLNTGDIYEYTGACNASLEQSSLWYTFTVQEDGLLSFIIDPLNPMDDYDWGCLTLPPADAKELGRPFCLPRSVAIPLAWPLPSRMVRPAFRVPTEEQEIEQWAGQSQRTGVQR